MGMNDRLKGEFYRVPMTKLASRSNVLTQINELIEYFNNLTDLAEQTFDNVSVERERMINILNQINTKTLHFKYILENFEPEITQHVEKKLATLMGTLSTNLNEFVVEYNKNLFNHINQTDKHISDDVLELDTIEEWDRSINHLSSNLGIRWFGGKLTNKFFVNQFNSTLHLVKVNTTDKYNTEDIINSGIIFEIFVFSKKGMTWLVLGQDGNFGYNLVTKYQSRSNNMNMKLVSKNYFAPQTYDINKFDLECIINTLLTQDDIGSDNVYINVKTNIPANSYSGREGYFISKSDTFNDEINKHSTINTASKLVYHDNKDIAYVKQETNDIEDVHDSRVSNIDTNYIINPKTKKSSGYNANTDRMVKYYSELTVQNSVNNVSLSITDKNNENKTLIKVSEKVSGRVVNPDQYIAVHEPYLKGINLQSKRFEENIDIVYNSGEQIEDLLDYRTVGKVQPILQNETMYEVDGAIGGETSVVNSDIIYGDSKNSTTLSNNLYNNSSFDGVSSKENSFHVLNKYHDDTIDNTINDIKLTSIGALAATNMGIYNFNKNTGIMAGSTEIKFQCIYESSNGVIYAGTSDNEGIYYYIKDNKVWESTNIRKGSISTFVEDSMGYIFAVSNNAGDINNEPEYDITTLNYKVKNMIYRGKTPTSFYAFEDMLSRGVYDKDNNLVTSTIETFNRDCYRWSSKNEAKWFINTSTKNRKAFFNYSEDRWYVFNPSTNKVFVSVDNNFYKFKLHEIHSKYPLVLDINYNDDILYISVIDSNEKTFVIEYENGDERRIKLNDVVIKNNREIIKQNVPLSTFEDLNIKGALNDL